MTAIRIWSDDYDKKFGDKNRFLVTLRGGLIGRTFRGQPRML